MEVEDPISAKFRTVVEALMLKTTSEIVKAFADVLLETRMEVSRSWMEIDDLKKELEKQREKQQAEPNVRSQTTQVIFKTEEDEMVVSQQSTMILESTESKGEVQISEDTRVEETDTRLDSVSVPEQATSERPETKAQMTHLEPRSKSDCTSPTQNVPEHQSSSTETQELPSPSAKAISVVRPQQPLSSAGIIILSKRSQEKGAAVSKKKYMQKKSLSTESNGLPHTLRDRHLLSSNKPCLCCTSGFRYSTSAQQSEQKKNSPEASCLHTCLDCGTKFQERMEFKNHKCCSKHKCTRCGQTFSSPRTLKIHNQHASPALKKPFPYKCYLCDHMFATRCGWNIHKRIHVHGHVSEIAQQNHPSPSHSFTVPKELKTKLEVRLERISDAQLEAALFPKGSFLLNDENRLKSVSQSTNVPSVVEPTPQTRSSYKPSAYTTMSAPMLIKDYVSNGRTELMDCQASSSGTESSVSVRQSDNKTEDSGFPTASSKKRAAEKWTKSLNAHRIDSVECDEGSSSAEEDLPKGLNSLSRKRKMSDCSHDIYNGVFPVEKILRWRNTKGQNEVRIKWMPCSLCGAKWKNTWEPAESFISYKDGKSEAGDKWN